MKKILNHLGTDWYKYLLELIVITAGVFGAFALNNWNESRKAFIEENRILANLNIEFRKNEKILDSSIVSLDKLIVGLDSLLTLTREPSLKLSTADFEIVLETTFSTPIWIPGSFVLEDVKNSGGLSQLTNDNLKIMLFDWERGYLNTSRVENSYDSYSIA